MTVPVLTLSTGNRRCNNDVVNGKNDKMRTRRNDSACFDSQHRK